MGRRQRRRASVRNLIELMELTKINNETFEWIFKTYYRALCFHSEGIIGEKEASEEIVSDFFLNLWENRESITITTSVQAYLYKGVYNNCLKYLEHMKVLRKYHDYAQYVLDNSDLFQSQIEDDPLALLISKETVAEIEKAIDALPAQCSAVFTLARFEELSYQEIADKLDVSINTVRTQITRAMVKLRESLGQLRKK